MKYEWADGFHPPQGVSAEAVAAAIARLKEPTPERLLDASKRPGHLLHDEFWSEGDQVWAQRGRLERARRILGAVQETVIVGGRTIGIRAVEFVRGKEGDGRWTTIDNIRSDPELMDAYLSEIQRLQDQASAKMARFRDLMAVAKDAAKAA